MRTRSEGETQRESRWREIVAGQRQSGQSVRAYCRQAGVEKSAFYWWRRELARRSTPLRVQQRNDPLPARHVIRPVKPTRPGARGRRACRQSRLSSGAASGKVCCSLAREARKKRLPTRPHRHPLRHLFPRTVTSMAVVGFPRGSSERKSSMISRRPR